MPESSNNEILKRWLMWRNSVFCMSK